MKKTVLFMIILVLLSVCGCSKSEPETKEKNNPTFVATEVPDPYAPSSTWKPTPTDTPTPVPTKKPEPVSVPFQWPSMTEMPKSFVEKANPEMSQISIDEKYFSGETFREYIAEYIDNNHDGLLSQTEREQVEFLKPTLENSKKEWTVVDGLDWFPNLKEFDNSNCKASVMVILDQHPGIERLVQYEGGRVAYYIDGCERLNEIIIGDAMSVAVYANDCPNLQQFRPLGNSFEVCCFNQTPNLCVYGGNFLPTQLLLDARARIAFTEMNFAIGGVNLEHFRYSSDKKDWTISADWLNADAVALDNTKIKGTLERIRNMNEAYLPENVHDDEDFKTTVHVLVYSLKNASVYGVWSGTEAPRRTKNDDISLHYYLVEGDGTIVEFDSVAELAKVADQRDDLKLYDSYTVIFPFD